ncbi:MAG: MarR family transcriptional regulator [Clostridia bacterium]|nr:MarR family transcriptional regulator [Clostridia bacterium]
MDYEALAHEYMEMMYQIRKRNSQKHLHDSMHGAKFALYYISMHKGNVMPSDISNEMGISTARIAAALNNLEKKGLVTRKIDVEDRRRILVELTSAGREEAQKHFLMIMDITTKMLQQLGEDDAKELVRIMKKLVDNKPEDCM